MELQDYLGKYGVLNDTFHKNTDNRGNQYHKHSYSLVEVVATHPYSYPLDVAIGRTVIRASLDEIDMLDDNDPIIKLQLGQDYDYHFGIAVITRIDYKNRTMQLKYANGNSEYVDVPKFTHGEAREIPVIPQK